MKRELEFLLNLLEELSGLAEVKEAHSDFVRGVYCGEKIAYDVAISEVERILYQYDFLESLTNKYKNRGEKNNATI